MLHLSLHFSFTHFGVRQQQVHLGIPGHLLHPGVSHLAFQLLGFPCQAHLAETTHWEGSSSPVEAHLVE